MLLKIKRWLRSKKNTGVLTDPRQKNEKIFDYFGIGAEEEILFPDGQADAYLPTKEIQVVDGVETWTCVDQSSDNCLETLHKKKYGFEINIDDQADAIMAGTKCFYGNYLQKVADSKRHNGCLLEGIWNAPRPIKDCSEFLGIELSEEYRQKAKEFLNQYEITYRWATNYKDELRYAPLQVVINNGSHAVMAYGYEGDKLKIYDSYWNDKYLYDISKVICAMRYNITRKNNDMEFIKTVTKSSVYLKLEDRIYPILEPTTFYQLSGGQDWNIVKVVSDSELAALKMQPKIFTADGLINVINK